MTSVGERLVQELANRGVEVVFGIPGVHTVELYRGLGGSPIRHVTSRHEQGAGFMADGYARALGSSKSGSEPASVADGLRPGVAFVITGPGVTNILTAMAQARAEGSPMLVVSSVNQSTTLGRGLGFLHELPNQHELISTVALASYQVRSGDDLLPAIAAAFDQFAQGRAGPVHIEVPMDVLGLPFVSVGAPPPRYKTPMSFDLAAVVAQLEGAKAPLILAGGGAKRCNATLKALAERLDAPVILTINARGLMHDHPLTVPASPSLGSVRELIAASDCVLALGTELGQTDYDLNC
ncbi:MAG: thiamine pyrophosphate-binding protein, partial [Rhodobacterales bacterium]